MSKPINPVQTLLQLNYDSYWFCSWARRSHFRGMPENKWRIWRYEALMKKTIWDARKGKVQVHPDKRYYFIRASLLSLNRSISLLCNEFYRDNYDHGEIDKALDILVEKYYQTWNEYSEYLEEVTAPNSESINNQQVHTTTR